MVVYAIHVCVRGRVMKVYYGTNRETRAESQQIVGQSLLSVLTIPRSIIKSSAKDLSPPIFEMAMFATRRPPAGGERRARDRMIRALRLFVCVYA